MQRIGSLVSCKWLSQILSPQNQFLRVLDATWHMPTSGVDSHLEFTKRHIPGAAYFDIDECTHPPSQYSHTLPTPEHFADYVGDLGICNDTHVVVYDNHSQFGIFSAPRVWWMFRVFGHNKVSVLNGGLAKWVKEGHPVMSSTGPDEIEKKEFNAVLQTDLLKTFRDMTANLETGKFQVMDARSEARFNGTAAEPRKGLPCGHIPNSTNVPFMSLLQDDGTESSSLMKSPDDLKEVFTSNGIDLSRPVTATCGSGVTACILALAAHQAGKNNVAVFDGSWEEYAQRATPDKMVVKRPADASAG